ncbi:hypothetical protein SDRG_06088 [Saprolegnia diclina VS20]|uniref:J domain-containing protein n=1 Tax=Saprolegnia diclina (strain VS20) TaxID=1156394 RepID=T0QPH9_SAPDV|nr:hypothetical protein SDRG_06088 [Saprolegnia diclina VS20]EQC36651.1 hypothetical protein SDRG_06088 [Saprolegnia diclina VS20]|eukprot:XP_008610072.1 hypothetical protein SDRG_06088 [Saprolegnia diclina VS20]
MDPTKSTSSRRRKSNRNSLFDSSDEDAERGLTRNDKGRDSKGGSDSRKGLFDDHDDENDHDGLPLEQLQQSIKERQLRKKAHLETLQAQVLEATTLANAFKADVAQLSLQLGSANAKIEKRNRQLQNAKDLVQSLQAQVATLTAQVLEENALRGRDEQTWLLERASLLRQIEEWKSKAHFTPLPISPTTKSASASSLLGKLWSKAKPKEEVVAPTPVTTTRPQMFTVHVQSEDDDDESSDSLLGSSDDDDDEVDDASDSDKGPVPMPPPLPREARPSPPVVEMHSTDDAEDDALDNDEDDEDDREDTATTGDRRSHTESKPPSAHEPKVPPTVSRMNMYMEKRAKKEAQKREKEALEAQEKNRWQEVYEQEWAQLAQEAKESKKKRKQKKPSVTGAQFTRISRQRPSSMKHLQKPAGAVPTPTVVPASPPAPSAGVVPPPPPVPVREPVDPTPPVVVSPPLPPEPSDADVELYRRQQARLQELHEAERLKREQAEETDRIKRDIHATINAWARGKSLTVLLSTLNQLNVLNGLGLDALGAITAPEIDGGDSAKKAYRFVIRVIHPDKLRNNGSIAQQVAARDVFTVVNQAFDAFKEKL